MQHIEFEFVFAWVLLLSDLYIANWKYIFHESWYAYFKFTLNNFNIHNRFHCHADYWAKMRVAGHNDPLLGETTCGSLLQQLQVLCYFWNSSLFNAQSLNAFFIFIYAFWGLKQWQHVTIQTRNLPQLRTNLFLQDWLV